MMAVHGPHCDAMLDEMSNGMTAIAEGRKVPDKCRICFLSFFLSFSSLCYRLTLSLTVCC